MDEVNVGSLTPKQISQLKERGLVTHLLAWVAVAEVGERAGQDFIDQYMVWALKQPPLRSGQRQLTQLEWQKRIRKVLKDGALASFMSSIGKDK